MSVFDWFSHETDAVKQLRPISRFSGWGTALIVGVMALLLIQAGERRRAADVAKLQERARVAQQQEAIAKANYAIALDEVLHDTVRVTRYATRYDSLRDTLWRDPARIHDTVFVKAALVAADSTVRACRALVSSIVPLKTACDSALAAADRRADANLALYNAVRPRWYDRLGVTAGYGAVHDGSGLHVGPSVGLSVRVWP